MRVLIRLIFVALCVGAPRGAGAADYGSHSIVSTIAGDGRIGVAAGRALQAHFVLPVGVSIGIDGSTLVVDAGANAVYRLRDGNISRVAGVVAHVDPLAGVAGGYADGPIAAALFDRPTAAVEVRGRGIFVADSGNHCIRSIAGGHVTTYAGSRTAGATDGPIGNATFADPDGLAVAPDGAILVADYGNGIRRIDTSGNVSTLSYGSKTILGIAAAHLNGHDIVAYTDHDAIHLVVDGKQQTLPASQGRMPTNDGVPIFHGWGIAILNENTVVVSDVMTSVIRLIRFPALPYVAEIASLALSGTVHEDTDFHGGFRDGNPSEALYREPRGIAVDPSGRVVIADAGNRRIRLLGNIDDRESALPDLSNFVQDPSAYNIVMIGQSFLFNGSLWNDSVPAAAETTFAQAAGTDRIGRKIRVQAIRADAVTADTIFDIADDYVSDRSSVDAVSFILSPATMAPANDLVMEANELARRNIKTTIYVAPEPALLALGEQPYNKCGCVVDMNEYQAEYASIANRVAQYRAAGLQADSFVPALAAAESEGNSAALADAADIHFTPAGQRLLGQSFARSLIADRAWLAKKAPMYPDVFSKGLIACPTAPVDLTLPNAGAMDRLTSGTMRSRYAKALADGDRLERSEVVNFAGWAFVAAEPTPDRLVCPVIDGSTGVSAHGDEHIERHDVAVAFHTTAAENSGFALRLDLQALSPGPHRIGTAVILGDGKAYPIGTPVDIVIK